MPTYTHRLVLILATVLALAGCGQQPVGPATDAVWQSVRDGDLPRLAKRLAAVPGLANAVNSVGNSLLYEAVGSPDIGVIEHLLNNGAEVNARDCRGSTPLIASAEFAGLPVLKLLVEAGADVPSGNLYGRSALHNAAKRDDSAAAEFLIEHGARLNQVCEYGTPLDLTANCEIAEVLRIAGGGASSDKSIASRTHDNYLTPLPSEK